MPRQNRVTPFGDLIATTHRGTLMGNRGCLHDAEQRVRRAFDVKRWIICLLEFKGRRRRPMVPGRYTELFFLDEATAFAAGHRPCALCRRADFIRFRELWGELHPGPTGADDIDARLHAERFDPTTRSQRRHEAPFGSLPDGVMVVEEGAPFLAASGSLLRWTPAGYEDARPRPTRGAATVVTPPSLVEVLRGDWDPSVPLLHPSAG